MRKIIRLFESGNVCVFGLRGRGKDMLFANVVSRRKQPYISNTDYGGNYHPLKFEDFDVGGNTYDNFINDNVKYYKYPYADGMDVYLGDGGIVLPAQYCNELNKKYGYLCTYVALTRQLGLCNFHFNTQNLNRMWDKVREQSDIYIMCNWCRVLFGKLVIQSVTMYERYESAVNRVPPYKPPKVRMNADRRLAVDMEKQRYRISHGEIKRRTLIYFNRSTYDTRIFKNMMENAEH